jgi:hypothetical protein
MDVREGVHTGLALNRRDRGGSANCAPQKTGFSAARANDDAAVATPRIGRGDF